MTGRYWFSRRFWLRCVRCLGYYAAFLLVAVIGEPCAVFHPCKELDRALWPEGVKEARFTARDGTALRALRWRAEPGAPTVLFFSGNGYDASRAVRSLLGLREWGVGVFALDYRGYGGSDGAPSEAAITADARVAWHHLVTALNVAPRDIVIWGHSLGTGPATWLASEVNPRLLVVQAGYTSLPDVAIRRLPVVPVHWLMRNRFPNIDRIAQVDAPVLIAHGEHDLIVPYSHGVALYQRAKRALPMMTLEGSHEASPLYDPAHRERFRAALMESDPPS